MTEEPNLFYQQLEEQCGPDYVKVIRCRDCKHYTQRHGRLPWKSDKRYCNRSATVATEPEDYCSRGEKRDI